MTSMDGKDTNTSSARRCWIEGRRVWLELTDDRLIGFPAERYPLLAQAPQTELENVRLRMQGRALRWETLDEDILVDDAINGRFPRQRQKTTV
jgi:Protein of unknown function (DUF2442)